MHISELLFVGIKGSVVALNRATGEQVWTTPLKGSDFVNVMVDGGQVFATCYGEVFCLDPFSGQGLWHNRLKGFGTGLAALATEDSARIALTTVLAEKARREQSEANAAAASAATVNASS